MKSTLKLTTLNGIKQQNDWTTTVKLQTSTGIYKLWIVWIEVFSRQSKTQSSYICDVYFGQILGECQIFISQIRTATGAKDS